MLDVPDKTAAENIRKMVQSSAKSWQNLFKQFSHKRVDPLWYGLLEKHFPPAVIAMKVVELNDEKKSHGTNTSTETITTTISNVVVVV